MDALIFEVEYQGKRYRLGVIGKEALESVKKHGYKDSNSKIHLRIPQSLLKEPIGWINERIRNGNNASCLPLFLCFS
ncbi:hypothetical protein [Metallosphaera sp.]|uniref:hypothetical protein n=1 Tax=Metallosphaera sp. TaxID=2020860 RepID=UPI00319D9C8C